MTVKQNQINLLSLYLFSKLPMFIICRYNVTFMVMTYFLPMMSMCYTYSRIGLELWGSRAIGEATEVQAESIKSKRKVRFLGNICPSLTLYL